MNWISANWVWILIAVAFVAMHLFGHGGHGGHRDDAGSSAGTVNKSSANQDEDRPSGHQH
jgi:hypothetical protein